MIPNTSRDETRRRIHQRLRNRLEGSQERPRLNVYRSLNHIYAQVIDDPAERLWFRPARQGRQKRREAKTGGNVAAAKEVGKTIAERAQGKRHQEGGF